MQKLQTGEVECVKETLNRTALCEKLKLALEQVSNSIDSERRTAKRIVQDTAGGAAGGGAGDGAPQVLDYVAQKAEMFELQQVLKTWERKVELMEMAAKRTRAMARKTSAV